MNLNPPRQWLIPLGLLVALTLVMFGNVLFASGGIVLSDQSGDLFSFFIHCRQFGFEQLGRGNLALWNPHVYSGAPFFGGGQAALLYPLNFLFWVLPLGTAVNWSIALHVFLAGAFTYLWAMRHNLHPCAGFLAAVIFMFGGAYFPHIYAGHLSNLCAMVWAPLLFLSVDEMLKSPSVCRSLPGAFAVAMQILAGHPQYVFYTGIAAGIYSLLGLFHAPARKHVVLGLTGMVAGGMALSAVQLFTSFGESRETLRSVGLSFKEAAIFSFPPENILTLLAPNFFGGFKIPPYWGRCYLWEMSVFMSVTGAALALAGAVGGERTLRRRVLITTTVLLVLALGKHTPLFKWFYEFVPGYDKFRGSSKFMMLASLFLALLAGMGLDTRLRQERVGKRLSLVLGVGGLLALAGAVWVWQSGGKGSLTSGWHDLMVTVYKTGESYLPEAAYADARFTGDAARFAAWSLGAAGMILLLVAGIFRRGRLTARMAGYLVMLATLELFVFAWSSLVTFDLEKTSLPPMKQFLAEYPGDYRILDPDHTYANAAMSLGAFGMWGYEPSIPLRYAQFIAFTQGQRPEGASQYVDITKTHRLYDMLRCRFVFLPERDDTTSVTESTNYLSHLLLVTQCRVLTNRDEILAVMNQPEFDPRRRIILETAPNPTPAAGAASGTVKLVQQSTDRLDIEADVNSPSILLITDSYAKGWRARALAGSTQSQYQLLPANWCLRAVPLAAGHHRLCVEYVPAGFVLGKWVSLISLVVFLSLGGRQMWRRRTG